MQTINFFFVKTVPVYSQLRTGTVPVYSQLRTGTVPVYSQLRTGTVPVYSHNLYLFPNLVFF